MSALLELDAGEHDDEPPELWQLVDLVAIACGGHAGDEQSMARVIAACAAQQLAAHPSYPDREGFGRRTITMAPSALADTIAAQCATLAAVAAKLARTIAWIKPHGALYHDAARDPAIAEATVRGACAALGDAIGVIGPPAGALREAARARGLSYLREGFADRGTRSDGSLVPRGEPGALVTDPAAAAARAALIAREVDAICVHADTPGALAIARAVREALRG